MNKEHEKNKEITNLIVNFLNGNGGTCKLSGTEEIGSESVNGRVKRLKYTGKALEEVVLMEVDYETDTLILNTERQDTNYLGSYLDVIKRIPYKHFDKFSNLDVTKHDFLGNNFIISSPHYPVNKFNRHYV